MTALDALSSGPERPRRRVHRGTALLLLAIGGLALGADRWQAGREAAALLRCVEQGEGAVAHASARVLGTVQYASPQLTAAATSPRVRTSLEGLVRSAAGDAGAPLTAARSDCAGLLTVPWRDELADARSAYVVVLERERERFAAIAADVDVLYRTDPALAVLREQALVALRRGLDGARETRVVALLSG